MSMKLYTSHFTLIMLYVCRVLYETSLNSCYFNKVFIKIYINIDWFNLNKKVYNIAHK